MPNGMSLFSRVYARLSDELVRIVREEHLQGAHCEVHLDGIGRTIEIHILGRTAKPCEVQEGTLEKDILRVLSEAKEPLKASVIAHRCGRKLDARLKIVLSTLRNVRVIQLGDDGYEMQRFN